MALSFGFEDRGFGRAYVLVEGDGPAGGSLAVKAVWPWGAALPVSLIRAPKAGVRILVAPLMAFDYEVSLEVRDAAGVLLESMSRAILAAGPQGPEFPHSQLLASGLDDIRYVDLNPTPDAVWLSPTKAIDFEDGTDVVHADAVALLPEGCDPGPMELDLFDLEGCRLDAPPPIVLDHEVEPAGMGVSVHRLQLSFHVPRELRAFVAGVRWGFLAGFTVAEPWLLDKLRGEWWTITHGDSNMADYHRWFLEEGRADDRTLHLQARTPLGDGPLFSIVVPVFETPLDFLAEMIDSVRAQTYPRWELLLVNASPADELLAAALAEAEEGDGRIRVLTLEGNRGISLNTRAGIEAATGDYLCFLDHDDVIEPDALFEYATAVGEEPSTALLYCDEDHFDGCRYFSGYFKPDFNLDLLLNHNYVTHFLCVSRRALELVRSRWGLPGPEFDGAQDYALTLFVAALGEPIRHVRRFLYHWRAHAASTSASPEAKPWTDPAGRRALETFLERTGLRGEVRPGVVPFHYLIDYEVPEVPEVAAVVTRTVDDDCVATCVRSLLEGSGGRLSEVVVVNPYGPLDEGILSDGRVREVRVPRGSGIAARRNRGAEGCDAPLLLFLDDRCVVPEPGASDWLGCLLGPLRREDVAVTGAGLAYEDGLTRHVGICLPYGDPRFVNALVPYRAEHWDYYRRVGHLTRGVSAVSGSALVARTRDFREVGGFDEGYGRGLDDVDLCLRLRERGRAVVAVPQARLTYRGRAENGRVLPFSYFGQPASPRDLDECVAVRHDEGLFRKRWARLWGFGDPFYNPQLAAGSCHYQMDVH